MISLPQVLRQFTNFLQTKLFPVLEEEIGQMTEQHQAFVRIL